VAELPDVVSRGLLAGACVLLLLGFIAIILASGSVIIMMIGMFLVLAGGGLGLKLGMDIWKATE